MNLVISGIGKGNESGHTRYREGTGKEMNLSFKIYC